MKKSFSKLLFLSLLLMLSTFAVTAQSPNDQIPYQREAGSFTILGGGTTTTTLAAATLDTLYFYANIPSPGPITITNTFTGATGSIAGTWRLFVSIDGTYFFPYPGANTGGTALDSVQVLGATALNSVPPGIAAGFTTPSVSGTVTNIFTWTKIWNIGKSNMTLTTNGTTASGNPYTHYLIQFISTASTTVALNGFASWKCQRISGY